MALVVDPIPIADDLIADRSHKMNGNWYRWLSQVLSRLFAATSVVATVHRTGLGSSISATTIYTPSAPATFKVTLSVQVTTAATTSSSIAATVTWTQNGVVQTKPLAALTGNTTTTRDDITCLFRPDSGLPIRYTTTYASVGATSMAYTLEAVVEQVTQ